MPKLKKTTLNPFKAIVDASGQARPDAVTVPAPIDTKAPGRRSREGYTQVGAYIPKGLYKDVQKRLVDEERNFSELVEELLQAYLNRTA